MASEKEQQAVVAYIQREDGKLLAIHDHRGYSAPGGKVESDETRLQALRREVEEETGVRIVDADVVYEGLHSSGRRVTTFFAKRSHCHGEPIALEPNTRVEWVDPEVIANGFASEYHRQALRAAGLWSAEPWEVIVKGRDLVLGYACPVCRIFHGATIYACRWEDAVVASREAAERCCNRKCEDCGKRVGEKHYVVCVDCGITRDAKREQERFAKAQKVKEIEYDGWLYYCGEYHEDPDAMEEYCLQNDLEWPAWVWACSKIEFKIDADAVLEHALQNHYEDARSSIPQAAERKLQNLLDAWCAGQGIVSWEEDRSRAVILEPRTLVDDD